VQIRDEQMKAMAQASEDRYVDRLVKLVTEHQRPEERDPDVRVKCQQCIPRARAAGLTTEFEVAAYVSCNFHFGPDFDSRPDLPFNRILEEPGTEPRLKAAQMVQVLKESEEQKKPSRAKF
jgi:hypothetical protein